MQALVHNEMRFGTATTRTKLVPMVNRRFAKEWPAEGRLHLRAGPHACPEGHLMPHRSLQIIRNVQLRADIAQPLQHGTMQRNAAF